jgi:hypothetical protein
VRLIDLLADVTTPAGPTPRELGALPPVSGSSEENDLPTPDPDVHD